MFFLSPIWLFGLLPWLVASVWLLWGRRQKMGVPYLPLWHGSLTEKRARQAIRPPPLPLAAMILAMLLAVLAAARPVLPASGAGAVTVLVDRGATMSAKGEARARFIEAASRGADFIRGAAKVDVLDVLTGARRTSDAGGWQSVVAALPRTAVDTSHLLRAAVLEELARGSGQVVLLSDHAISVDDQRLVQIAPPTPIRNVAITALAAREGPASEVMVVVRNNSAQVAADLHVASAGQDVIRRVHLPPMGKEQRYFVDVPHFGDVIEARLALSDDLEAGHAAWLVREAAPPRLEVRSVIPATLKRMVDVYSRTRPPRQGSPVALILNRREDLMSGDVGAIVDSPTSVDLVAGEVRVVDHALTAVVNWREATQSALAAAQPPAGWKPLVQKGNRTLVAVAEAPSRQVWVGFDAEAWPRSADYVVFWTNVFSWLGGDGRAFAAGQVTVEPDEWKREGEVAADVQPNAWPGVYRRSDGALKAASLGAMSMEMPVTTDRLSALPNRRNPGRDLGSGLSLISIACVALAAACWRRAPQKLLFPAVSPGGSSRA